MFSRAPAEHADWVWSIVCSKCVMHAASCRLSSECLQDRASERSNSIHPRACFYACCCAYSSSDVHCITPCRLCHMSPPSVIGTQWHDLVPSVPRAGVCPQRVCAVIITNVTKKWGGCLHYLLPALQHPSSVGFNMLMTTYCCNCCIGCAFPWVVLAAVVVVVVLGGSPNRKGCWG